MRKEFDVCWEKRGTSAIKENANSERIMMSLRQIKPGEEGFFTSQTPPARRRQVRHDEFGILSVPPEPDETFTALRGARCMDCSTASWSGSVPSIQCGSDRGRKCRTAICHRGRFRIYRRRTWNRGPSRFGAADRELFPYWGRRGRNGFARRVPDVRRWRECST